MPSESSKYLKKKPPKRKKEKKVNRFPPIEEALRKQAKSDLVKMLMTYAKKDVAFARELERTFNVETPIELLIHDVGVAIANATEFDDHVNHDFDVDWQAYEDVKKGLKQLVAMGQLEDAKTLALRLMKDGSYQVECSDEGLMSDDICDCLCPVIRAVKKAGGKDGAAWASEMRAADRCGFICEQELAELRSK